MKHSTSSSKKASIDLLPTEIEELSKQLGRPATLLEQLTYGAYRSTSCPAFTIADNTRFTVDLSSSIRPTPQEISKNVSPLAQYHNLLFGALEIAETQALLKNSLEEIGETYASLQTPIVDGKIKFLNAIGSSKIHQSFSLFERKTADDIGAQEGDLILFLTTQEADLITAAIEICKKEGVQTVLPLVENNLLGSLTHWGVEQNCGIQLDTAKLKLIQEDVTAALIQSVTNGLVFICKANATETLATIIDDYANHLVQIGNSVHEKAIAFVTTNEIDTKVPYDLVLNTKKSIVTVPNNEGISSFTTTPASIADFSEPNDLKEVAIQLLSHPTIASLKNVVEKGAYFPNAHTTALPEPTDATISDTSLADCSLAFATACLPTLPNDENQLTHYIQLELTHLFQQIYTSGALPKIVVGKISLTLGQEHLFEKINSSIKNTCAAFGLFAVELSLAVSSTENELSLCSLSLVGVINNTPVMTNGFKYKGDLIFILGENKEDISGSTYASVFHKDKLTGLPYFNAKNTLATLHTVQKLIQSNLINAAHSCGKGGIFIALTEMALPNELGFDIVSDAEIREDAFLFGETVGRVLVTVNEDNEDDFLEFMLSSGLSYTLLGHVTKGKLVVDDDHYGFIQEAKDIYENALGNLV